MININPNTMARCANINPNTMCNLEDILLVNRPDADSGNRNFGLLEESKESFKGAKSGSLTIADVIRKTS